MSDNTNVKKRDFFVSYTEADEDWARKIAVILKNNGYSVYIQMFDTLPGDNFIENMGKFLENSLGFIAVASPSYFKSGYCTSEWEAAFKKYRDSGKTYQFFIFRIEAVDIPILMQPIVYQDLFGIADVETTILSAIGNQPNSRGKTATDNKPTNNAWQAYHLPERNFNFSGRENDLYKLRTSFSKSGTILVKQLISGLGGVGKTQLALEYAHRSKHEYTDAVWWIDAEKADEVKNSLLRLARKLGILPKDIESPQALTDDELSELLQDWFQEHPSFLLVFDNVENTEDIEKFIPHNVGHVLITTRDRNMRLLSAKSVELDVLTPDEARVFLREHAPNAVGDEQKLDELIERLGRLPLALKQAAAYMAKKTNNCDYEKYLKFLDQRGLGVFASKNTNPLDYHAIVSTTWQVSIEKTSESAKQLLYMCAYMASNDIPLEFFTRQREYFPEPLKSQLSDDFTTNEIVEDVTRYALAERDGDMLSIHRLVQEVVREQAQSDDTDWLELVFNAIRNAMPGRDDYSTREVRDYFKQIAPHAASIADYASIYEDEDNQKLTALLCSLLGTGHNESAQYSQALKWHHKALEIREKVLGLEHPNTTTSYAHIANVYDNQGDYLKALEWNHKALEIREKVLGLEHSDTATTYNNIAGVYYNQGDYPKALELYHKALDIREKVLGTEHPDTATTYNNIALVYNNQGDYPKALEWLHNALKIDEKVLGIEHPNTAPTYNNIANVYRRQGDYPKALEWYHKALNICEKVLGLEHPSTAITYSNIAFTHENQSDYPEALEWYQKALKIREKVFGAEHLTTTGTREGIEIVKNFINQTSPNNPQ